MKSNPIFKKVDIKTYDISGSEAKKILEENEISALPAILLDSNILVE
jgi:hypothetical protein